MMLDRVVRYELKKDHGTWRLTRYWLIDCPNILIVSMSDCLAEGMGPLVDAANQWLALERARAKMDAMQQEPDCAGDEPYPT